MNLKYYFEFKILCPVADKGNSTGKDKRSAWGWGQEAGGQWGSSCAREGVMRSAQIGTTVHKWKYKKMEQNGKRL